MSRRYYQRSGNKDANHDAVVGWLADMRWHVTDVSKVPNFVDLHACKDFAVLIEVKDLTSRVLLSQLEFISTYPGDICFIQTFEDCKRFNANPLEYCLSKKRKAEIYKFYVKQLAKTKAKTPMVAVSTIERAIGKL